MKKTHRYLLKLIKGKKTKQIELEFPNTDTPVAYLDNSIITLRQAGYEIKAVYKDIDWFNL